MPCLTARCPDTCSSTATGEAGVQGGAGWAVGVGAGCLWESVALAEARWEERMACCGTLVHWNTPVLPICFCSLGGPGICKGT